MNRGNTVRRSNPQGQNAVRTGCPVCSSHRLIKKYEQANWSGAGRYARARKTIADASGQAQRAATEWMQQTRAETDAYVREQPWIAIGVAAGVGFLVGAMLRR